jgi:hypothetical protein
MAQPSTVVTGGMPSTGITVSVCRDERVHLRWRTFRGSSAAAELIRLPTGER